MPIWASCIASPSCLLPPVVGFDAAIAPLLFSNATDEAGDPLYDVVTCALTDEPVAATTGFAMVAQAGPEALADRRHRRGPRHPLPAGPRRRHAASRGVGGAER